MHSNPGKRVVVRANGPDGQAFTVKGQAGRALVALVEAGPTGVTPQEMASWAYRLSHYILVLRHRYGLAIHMAWEPHEGGKHGRYILRSIVTIIKIISG